MRLWSIHPQYLDRQGLLALWREALLAKHVLEGKTKGYKKHPQLVRFKTTEKPLDCINQYLSAVYEEAVKRGYDFERNKINWDFQPVKLPVASGQIEYERLHLIKKLKIRDKSRHDELLAVKELLPHPLFEIKTGEIEDWEKVKED
ncbi:MAG: pyrimidine dimer DNA glycosylase/endonuclease V [Bacteroidota bacterium]|nr:pyrimidine dimer DNA glycosylase/endonuclease V [Bacteroidota bacterium]